MSDYDQNQEHHEQEPVVEPMVEPQPLVSQAVVVPNDAWTVAVSRWINEHIRNTPIAASVEAWNHLGGVLPKLKEFLDQELKNSPPPSTPS